MVEKYSNIKERVLFYAKNQGISIEHFLESIGISYGSFKGKAKKGSLNSNAIAEIYTKYGNLNMQWLLTGEGPMILPQLTELSKEEEIIDGFISSEGIPLVEKLAVAGFGNHDFNIDQLDVKDRYVIPKFKNRNVDFMLEVTGSSMYPKYRSGDVVACTIIHESSFIQWNKTHLIGTREQGLLLKRLKPGSTEDLLLAVSDHRDYEPFEIPKDEISGLAIVIGVVRLE